MKRTLVLGLAVALVFTAVAAILLKFMPQPMKDSDFLVVGSVATLVSLLVLFFALAGMSGGVFMKRRKKQ